MPKNEHEKALQWVEHVLTSNSSTVGKLVLSSLGNALATVYSESWGADNALRMTAHSKILYGEEIQIIFM